MSREIKFRAWEIKNKIMHNNVCQLDWHTNSGITNLQPSHIYSRKRIENSYGYNKTDGIAYKFELMQFIGEKDKNGKDIYEGDIIERKYYHNNPPSKRPKVKFILVKMVVVFSGGSFHLDNGKYDGSDYGTTINERWNNMEILGNIYETPELLNK